MIIVTGATGHLGGLIVNKLLDRMPATQVGVSVRDPDKAANLKSLGVRVRQGDFENPDSLRHAFEGAEQLLLVSSNAAVTGGDPLAQHRKVIKAAQDARVGRIVYTSQMAASASSAFPPMHHHAATEQMLAESGLAWTALRNGFYGASGIMMMRNAFEAGELKTAADGKFSWVAHDDLAEAAAIILASNGQYDGPTQPLTGSEALDFADLADIATKSLGKPFRRKVLADSEMHAEFASRGMPPKAIAALMGMFEGAKNGEWATIDPTLERLLGRPPIKMRDLIKSMI